jgi:hypothetical protein
MAARRPERNIGKLAMTVAERVAKPLSASAQLDLKRLGGSADRSNIRQTTT